MTTLGRASGLSVAAALAVVVAGSIGLAGCGGGAAGSSA